MIPIAGSAYAYSYVTMGELVAWIIGWALIMEYALGAATVSIAWSEYLNKLWGGGIPYEWCHSPFESFTDAAGILHQGIMNLPALFILLALTALLIRGTQESAFVNSIIVFVKVAIVLLFIGIGWKYINPANHSPYLIPEGTKPVLDSTGKVLVDYSPWNRHGWGGILGGAAIVFFAFIGFEGVVNVAGHIKDARIGFFTEHFVAPRIDRHDLAGITVLAQKALRARGVLFRIAGGADQRDGARSE